jgi:hypothetical protein
VPVEFQDFRREGKRSGQFFRASQPRVVQGAAVRGSRHLSSAVIGPVLTANVVISAAWPAAW